MLQNSTLQDGRTIRPFLQTNLKPAYGGDLDQQFYLGLYRLFLKNEKTTGDKVHMHVQNTLQPADSES